ncbi:hypothetical protein, partial [Nonomuraea rubra]|uniref:hypothetical protein n=1 Tax=Nonomuraea rubra TaxID=46180 RepID=UPI0031E60DBC
KREKKISDSVTLAPSNNTSGKSEGKNWLVKRNEEEHVTHSAEGRRQADRHETKRGSKTVTGSRHYQQEQSYAQMDDAGSLVT